MEKLVDDRLVKAIGLANFNQQQIQKILDNCKQVEGDNYDPSVHWVGRCPSIKADAVASRCLNLCVLSITIASFLFDLTCNL